ncbi:Cytochrome P450 [Nonomuraea jiangxiensis]|uniref:Cytochrome P450 n=2 Tax=Nonomuraea jiangxiensis TaxID=633440 RepID=A0A1G8M996_9ACTN|nr:Cytochrome P450 [Nonomuraea jiangxiensis]
MTASALGSALPSPFSAVIGDERHAVYAELAARGPVHPITTPAGGQAWLVTSYDHTRALLTDPRLIKGGWRNTAYADRLPEAVARGIHTTMLNNDPPMHTRLRKLVMPSFSRRKVERLIPRIQQMTDELLAALDGEDSVDLIPALAYPLPIGVICELIGIAEEDRADFRAWTPPVVSPGVFGFDEFQEAITALLGFSRDLVRSRRHDPRDDLLSDLIRAGEGEDGLTDDELTSMIFLLVVAGHETTVNLIGNGVRALLAHPDQLARLRERPELLEPAIEELLRYDGPVQSTLSYRTTEPIDVDGTKIPADAAVFFALMAANRDPHVFPDGDTLDISGEAPAHIAFGHGIHHCVGAPLARIEARIAIGTLIERFPGMRLAASAEGLGRTPSVIINGLSALPVHLRA